jgi:hypothetical protein
MSLVPAPMPASRPTPTVGAAAERNWEGRGGEDDDDDDPQSAEYTRSVRPNPSTHRCRFNGVVRLSGAGVGDWPRRLSWSRLLDGPGVAGHGELSC